jgi:hypothetical protein
MWQVGIDGYGNLELRQIVAAEAPCQRWFPREKDCSRLRESQLRVLGNIVQDNQPIGWLSAGAEIEFRPTENAIIGGRLSPKRPQGSAFKEAGGACRLSYWILLIACRRPLGRDCGVTRQR